MAYDSDYEVRLATLGAMGGDVTKKYDSVYSIDLEILRLTEQGGGGAQIDDETIATDKTWSSSKINTELGGKQATLTAGTNISIDANNTISALGYTYDSAKNSFGEGTTTASGNNAHTEGASTIASGFATHAEGMGSEASGRFSHAEGYYSKAPGESSHAEGDHTLTSNKYEHAQGLYNKTNYGVAEFGYSGNTIHSIGIGNAHTAERKNAFEVMQNGDAYMVGIGGYDGTTISGATTLQNALAQVRTLTQAEYDALVSGGTVNANTLYIISDAS